MLFYRPTLRVALGVKAGVSHALQARSTPASTCLSNRGPTQSNFSTSRKKDSSNSPIYELRCYQTPPANLKAVNDVFNEHMDLRTKHSKLVGFWTAEVGDVIAQVVHIWEYENLAHRLAVRQAIPKDEVLVSKYLSKVMPLMSVMKNYLVVPAPQTQIDCDFVKDPNAVYVLQTVSGVGQHSSVPGSKVKDEKLICRLSSVLGPGDTEFRLWRYQKIDSVTDAWTQRAKDSPTTGSTLLMYPTPFSPMQ